MKNVGIGIDFGTTNSLAAVWGSDIVRMMGSNSSRPPAFWDTARGNLPHPSVVWFSAEDKVVVGSEARRNMEQLSGTLNNHFVRSIKRSLDQETEVLIHGGKKYRPYEVAAEIFRHLKADAEKRGELQGHTFDDCVVTIPVGFDGSQRREIRKAMERAGLSLQSFLHEPFAALISHFYHPDEKLASLRDRRALVFDWGGGTLDVCLAEGSRDGTKIYELGYDGIADRAGDDFDRRIMAQMRRRFLERNPTITDDDLEVNSRAQDRFWIAAEKSKMDLSESDLANVVVPNFIDGPPPLDLKEKLKRDEFEDLIKDEVNGAVACALRCLRNARLKPAAIDYVLMVGGTSKVPLVRREMEKHFGTKVMVADEPDAAIARGAAIVAAEGWKPFNAIPIGLKLSDETFFTILDRGDLLEPDNSKKYVFYCTDPRVGAANFVFARKPVLGDKAVQLTGDILQVPVKSEKPVALSELDRVIASFTITRDSTLLCTALHSGLGQQTELELTEISFGLSLNA